MHQDLRIITLAGKELEPYFTALAHLRIKLFREFPYLYDGSLQYEKEYLKTYAECPDSRIMLVQHGDNIIGATTSIPLKKETADFQKPFLEKNIDINPCYYLGESLLLPEYRGQGIYRQYFTFREQAAIQQGYSKAVFVSVIRPDDHSLRPKNYQPLNTVWQHFGYQPIADLQVYFSWKDVDNAVETKKALSVWIKNL